MSTIYRDQVNVGDFVFNTETPLYYDFRIDSIAGWDDGPDLEINISDYGVADGGSAGFFPAKSKYMQIEGYVVCGSRLAMEEVKGYISAAFPRNTDIVIQRFSPIPKQMTIRRASKIEYPYDEDGFEDALRFVLTVVATDPFRYSVTETVLTTGISTPDESGRIYPRVYPMVYDPVSGADTGNLGVTFNNVGSAASYPVSIVTGPVSAGGWQIANDTTGQRLTFDISVGAGQTLEIDHATHSLKFNGYKFTARAEGEWWPLVPGDNFIRFTSSVYDAAASLEIHARSSWE